MSQSGAAAPGPRHRAGGTILVEDRHGLDGSEKQGALPALLAARDGGDDSRARTAEPPGAPGALARAIERWERKHLAPSLGIELEAFVFERGTATHIEHRLADGAANPYVAAATVLQAARLGVEEGYPLPAAETGDGLESVDTDVCVPENLGAALYVL